MVANLFRLGDFGGGLRDGAGGNHGDRLFEKLITLGFNARLQQGLDTLAELQVPPAGSIEIISPRFRIGDIRSRLEKAFNRLVIRAHALIWTSRCYRNELAMPILDSPLMGIATRLPQFINAKFARQKYHKLFSTFIDTVALETAH